MLAKRGQAVAIGRLERFVGDFEVREHSSAATPAPSTGRRVAVVGSGPAGLTSAVDLAKLGHKVVIFESLHLPGGVLIYGIPEFRLPKSIIRAELVVAASNLGIEIRTDHVIGNTYTLDELLNEFDAVFMGTGAGLPSFMRIPGINLNGVMSANEFLTRVNLMKGYRFPEYDTPVKVGQQVAVIGAGNVAMDAARRTRCACKSFAPGTTADIRTECTSFTGGRAMRCLPTRRSSIMLRRKASSATSSRIHHDPGR